MSAEEKGLAEKPEPETAPETTPETAVAPAPPAPPKEPLSKKLFGYIRIFFSADPSWTDYLLLLIGTISALAAGVPFPLMGIVFGQLVDDMNGATCAVEAANIDPFMYEHDINDKVLIIVYIAIAAFCLIYIYVLSWSLISQRLAARLRNKYVSALLRQPPAFFDTRAAGGEVSTRLHGDMAALQAGTSEKVGVLLASISFFITAYVVAFIKQAKLAGILVSLIPAYLAMGLVGGAFFQKYMIRAAGAIASASSIASEALKNVIVVQAFGAAPRLEAKFADHMANARDAGIKRGMSAAVQAGLLYFIAYAGNALAFWEGSRMVADAMAGKGNETIGQIYTVIFILVDACVVLGNISPLLPLLGGAQAAFDRLMKDIEEPSPIDGTSDEGVVLPYETRGEIRFENVSFSYPSRPDQLVLKNVDLTFPAGKHTAIVGLSGSGKSTVAAMISRLQDPNSGKITMDGYDLKELNVRSLRSFISLVQQEPSLLDRSILENIALGLINSPKPEHQRLKDILHSHELADLAKKGRDSINPSTVSSFGPLVEEIISLIQHAATEADAANFIERLEKGYGTYAGPSGSMVSGGQRQRVALARALIRDPKILLLDEATSALDSASERRIQEAVDRAAKSRTVISIAHRLSTIRNADKIVVMEAGKVIEEGSYDELMAKEDGAFAKMANLQTLGTAHHKSAAAAGGSVSGESIESESSATETSVEKPSAAAEVAVTPAPAPAANAAAANEDEIPGLGKRPIGSVISSLIRFLRPSLGWLLLAIFAAVIVGGTFSGSGVLFGFTIGALNPCSSTMDKVLYYGKFFGGFLFMLACIEFFANFAAWSCFALIAEKLLYAMRVLSFRSLMEQGVQWHQSEGRSPSSLLTIITKDSASVGAFSGSTIGTVFSICVNFIAAIILSHIFAWKIAIVCLSIVPILLGTGLMQLRMLARYEERHAEAFNKATNVAVEAVQTIKTVAALSLEHEVLGSYERLLKNNRDEMVKAAAFTNIWLALANSISFLVYAFAYWWGSQRIMHGEYSQRDFFIVLVSMLVSAQLWGQMFSLAPEFSRARLAISRILGVIGLGSNDHVHDSSNPTHRDLDPEAIPESTNFSPNKTGVQITFNSVSFSYPSRPDHQILDSISFTIQPGQFVGLVGPSGAGKSTIMNLVQRLYAPTAGSITIDGVDLSQANTTFRDSVALVPQEAALFDGSVKFNVGLGARPGTEASDAEIEEACRLASIHDVIASLPEGYETECGASASRLSGGQRQRLAIARALVRKPRLLLLDESTSALDAASEAALQEGLDKVAQNTTVLAITHRLHTVRKADVIFVVEGGRIVDKGTHEELMARRESYRVNAMQQMLQ